MPGYEQIIAYYDPDIVFYSSSIDIEVVKQLRLFNPIGYFELGKKPSSRDITGVDVFYLLSFFDSNAKVMLAQGFHNTKNTLLNFYRINFGLNNTAVVSDYEISKKYQQVIIDGEKLKEINKIIHHDKPVNVAALSKINLNTIVLRSLKYAQYDDFEIIVAKDHMGTVDLLYYWNRGLYQHKNLMYVTLDELKELCKDKFFGGVLHDLKGDKSVHVVSMTLSKEEIEALIKETLRPIGFNTNFFYKDISMFPFEITDGNGLYERNYGEQVNTQTLVSETGLVHLPKLSFTNAVSYYSQEWAVDLEIKADSAHEQQRRLFPLTTQVWHIAKEMTGRINLTRNISIIINNQRTIADTFKLNVPSFNDLARQLIIRPVVHGESTETKIIDIGPHDASNRLNAFIKAFKYNFSSINDFFSDKFWVDILEYLSTNEKVAGDAITFSEIFQRAEAMYAELGKQLMPKGQSWFNAENLQLGLKRMVIRLCSYQVFFKGFNLKCPMCSSEFWYHINEVREVINCKGCLQDYTLPIEPEFAYKLNDLIRNNIFQTRTTRDGNLTVIRTLGTFRFNSSDAFQYSSQVNLYDDYHSNKPCGDLDILCLENGKLIIGEAKYSSKGFMENKAKSLASLAEIAKQVYPDVILLTCSKDENKKLEKAKTGLLHHFKDWPYTPKIEIMTLSEPDYFEAGGNGYFVY
ncbi:hypothetical protein [Mucilaginibacter sp. L196]|uniref:hypothetical protein n=1 Tax=Mucilaginibacter sp. L196 TaxID=1641870 RepID=UPI00131C5C58|nr:hypothetical protein [Mucilaginibacter sp. L196]